MVLEVGLEVKTLHLQSAVEVTDEVLGLGDIHRLRDLCLQLLDESAYKLLLDLAVSLLVVSVLYLCLDISLVFSESIEFGDILRELVVKSRKLVELDLVELDS